jgi:enoyl-CoA hydratase
VQVGAIILCGAGDDFCSGHDLGSPEQLADIAANPYEVGVRGDVKKWRETDSEMCLKWRSLPKPTICAVQGYCIYHACAVASSCDIILAADDAKFMPSLVEATFLPWCGR